MKNVKNLFAAFALTGLMMACATEEVGPDQGSLSLMFQSSGSNSFGSESARLSGTSAVEITDFQIAIRDVTFKSSDKDTSSTVNFRGPYQLDLLNGSDALSQTIGEVEIPNGMYKEVRFELHKDKDVEASNPLYDRSIYLKGTINGIPFEMWHDTSENFDIGRSTGVEVKDNKVELVVNFSLDQFLSSKHQIDLTQAKDGDGDGLIEINSKDEDGNKELADLLKENIKMAADLLDAK
jgi:hypothetical protein